MRRSLLRHGAIAAIAALLLAGCGEDAPENPAGPDGETDTGIATDLDDPLEVIAAHFQALGQMDTAAYADLLEQPVAGDSTQGFRFYLLDKDAQDFPWLQNDWWGRTQEMTFIGNMCDPDFVGANPPVQSIHAAYNLLSRQDTPPGIHKLWADAVLTVLTGPMDGFSVDTRLVFTLAEQADGHLRIRTIREVEKLKRGDRSVEEASWGSIKALYR